MAKMSALGYFGLGKETTFGTAVAPAVYIPYDSIKVEEDIKKVTDEGRRGILSKSFGVYNTTRQSKVEFGMPAYPDLIGHLLMGILGKDTVTGSAAPYTHKFQVLDALAPTFTASDYNTVTERRYAGAILDELDFKFDADTAVKVTAKMKSKASVVASKSTPTITVAKPFLGFTSTLTLGSTVDADLLGGEVSIKRDNQLIFAGNNTQDPTRYITGRIEATGKLTMDFDNEDDLNAYLNGTQQAVKISFVLDANTSLEFSFGKVDVTKVTVDRSQEYIRADMSFKALYNATDAGMVTVTLKNAVATY
ncbi:TPA: hypothetical protein QCY70_004944 [Bacillus cereus]|uniref:phage tail tube protein n=1 Tax=Bacillus cereus group TaxID=86661 RepID=UPI0032FC1305|nr:hypothetical protein [Bacillus cereus]HDR8014976.1 hypothetical protein [Bacillus cereus]